MASINPATAFVIGIIVAILAILIFYFAARSNKNVADIYRTTICAGIA